MHVNEFCPPKHLEAADLCGKDVVVTIKSYAKHEVGKDKEVKGVLFFDEFPRGMVMNRTNTGSVAGLYGADVDKWIGKKITLFESLAAFGGVEKPCIRIRKVKPE